MNAKNDDSTTSDEKNQKPDSESIIEFAERLRKEHGLDGIDFPPWDLNDDIDAMQVELDRDEAALKLIRHLVSDLPSEIERRFPLLECALRRIEMVSTVLKAVGK